MVKNRPFIARRRGQRGDAIVEGTMALLFLCLILFGLLQIFYLCAGQMLTQYSAYKAARATGVGLADYIAWRVAKTSVAGASGQLLTPPNTYTSLTSQAASELFPLPTIRTNAYSYPGFLSSYQSGISWLDYQYWYTSGNSVGASFWNNVSSSGDTSTASSGFNNFPMNLPMRGAFLKDDHMDISASAELMNSAEDLIGD